MMRKGFLVVIVFFAVYGFAAVIGSAARYIRSATIHRNCYDMACHGVRIYNRALSDAEIAELTREDTRR